MNAFQRAMVRAASTVARGLFGVQFGTPGADTWESSTRWAKGLSGPATTLDEPYSDHGPFATGVSIISSDAAGVPLELYPGRSLEESGDAPIDAHPVLDLLGRPSPTMTGYQLLVGTYISRYVFGEWFWHYPDVVMPRPRTPSSVAQRGARLELLDPRRVVSKIGDDGSVSWGLKVGNEARVIPLDASRLTHCAVPNPYDPVRGLSPLRSILTDMKGDAAAAEWNERVFGQQNGVPTGVLSPAPGTYLDDDQRNEFRRSYQQMHGGTRRSVLMLPAGWSFDAIGLDHAQMGYRDLREYAREQVLARLGVPPFIAGVLDKANYANAREQRAVYWNGTITRLLTETFDTINADFLPKIGATNVVAVPKWESVKSLVEDYDQKVETGSRLWAMGVPFREINDRLELGFDPDAVPHSDTGFVPFNVIPTTLAAEPPEPAPVSDPPPSASPGSDEIESPGTGERSERRRLRSSESVRGLQWRSIISRVRDVERQFQRTMRSHFEQIRREALDSLDGPIGVAASIAPGVQKQDGDFLAVFDLDAANGRLRRRTRPLHRRALVRGGESVIAEATLDVVFDLDDPRVLARLAAFAQSIVGINTRLASRMRDSLADGVANSESLDKLRDRVQHAIDVSMGRSLVIARTETGAAYNAGRFEGMQQAGITKHEWLSSRDADVRDSHEAEDGNVVEVGAAFPVTGMTYPQGDGPPEEVINCRCVATPVASSP